MAKDYYQVLGVGREASGDEMKKAYRSLAMQFHPDRNSGDKGSEERFKEINEAYSVLSDPKKRANYDQFGTAEGVGAGAGFGGFGGFESAFGDIFEDVFGDFFGGISGKRTKRRSARGNDLRYDLEITLEEAAFGTDKEIEVNRWHTCEKCSGSGSKSGRQATCSECNGSGQLRFQQGFFVVSKTCGRCKGEGSVITDPCGSCHGQGRIKKTSAVNVKIPPGVDSNLRLKMSGEGEPGRNGGPQGDLYIVIDVKPHDFFEREEMDIYYELPLTFPQAVLGTEVEVPTLDGTYKLKIPAGTQARDTLRIKGKGIPRLGGRSRGDQVAVIKLVVPRKISQRQKELIEEFEKLSDHDTLGSFKDRIKSIFAGTA